jgi:hypothetical protein
VTQRSAPIRGGGTPHLRGASGTATLFVGPPSITPKMEPSDVVEPEIERGGSLCNSVTVAVVGTETTDLAGGLTRHVEVLWLRF